MIRAKKTLRLLAWQKLSVSLTLLIMLVSAGVDAQTSSLTTTFSSDNGQAGNMFDVVAFNSVTVVGFDVNLDPGTWNIEIYAVFVGGAFGGSYVGLEAAPGSWALIETYSNITSLGMDIPTPLPQTLAIPLAATAIQGFYITVSNGAGMNYTIGTAVGVPFAADANIEIQEGAGIAYPFSSVFAPRVWNGTIHYASGTTTPDVSVCTACSPATPPPPSNGCLSTMECITIELCNNGPSDVASGTSIPVTATIALPSGGTLTCTETYNVSSTFAANTSMTFTFTKKIDMSAPGQYGISVSHGLPNLNPGNDVLKWKVWSCPLKDGDQEDFGDSSFSFLPGGWSQDAGDGGEDWQVGAGPTANPGTGPAGDHTTGAGRYAYVPDTNSGLTPANLISPAISTGAATICTFWVHSDAPAGANALHVDVLDVAAAPLSVDADVVGATGSSWTLRVIDLAAFPMTNVRLRFRVEATSGADSHDIAIDDFAVAGAGAATLGTGDDFRLRTILNGGANPSLSKAALPGDLIAVTLDSPSATFDGRSCSFLAQLFQTGAPPSLNAIIPGVHLDFGAHEILNTAAIPPPLGPGVLAPGGFTLGFAIPAISGYSVRFQGIVIGLAAINGFYAATDAHDIHVF